ncbi:hypothetical protein [Pedobacter frigiditerrae]|uniref:hypothetical protein n=1 Tax=Pedobacter frigiditerrae TaxID=2530452 RepID=UPI00292F0F75|nr:hypothetical protein [Pedobacter frigiditerrae]
MISAKGQKICYLLGAGASAKSLPVVGNLPERLKKLSDNIERDFQKITPYDIDVGINDLIAATSIKGLLIQGLEWLSEESNNHSSIDTFAKKLFLQDDKKYYDLKLFLSEYFAIEQWKNQPDLRYDNFWASILDKKDTFPNRLRILSWNYDSQIEQSFLNFTDTDKLNICAEKLRVYSAKDDLKGFDKNLFSVFKLNGSATFKDEGISKFYSDNYRSKDCIEFYSELLKNQYQVSKKLSEPNLSFAWEHNTNEDYFTRLKESVWETNVLVVIGYSFPFFNRNIDKFIINECMPSLNKIYIQAPDADILKERLISITGNDIHSIVLNYDQNQFLFPTEL